MGYRHCFFAVRSADADAARTQFATMARELRSENGYRSLHLATADHGGLHLMHLTAEPAPRGRVPRSFFTERWSGGELFVAIYNDRSGVYLWEAYGKGSPKTIMNDAHLVGTDVALTVDYAGKGFTNEQLAAVMKKDPSAMTAAEARAVMEWTDAITIGIAQYGFTATRGQFIDLLGATTAWSLLEKEERPLPPQAGPIVDPYIEAHEFESVGLEFRDN